LSGSGVRDLLVARIVGEVFRCDLCDPCMMFSCAFILVKNKFILACISSLFPRISGRAITSGIRAHVQTLGSLCICCPYCCCCVGLVRVSW
jgi:hypothetical protein